MELHELHYRVAIKMMLQICDAWGIDREGLSRLLPISAEIVDQWRGGDTSTLLTLEQAARASQLITIHINLMRLLSETEAARWVRSANADFGGRSPLETMLNGSLNDLSSVSRYIEVLIAL